MGRAGAQPLSDRGLPHLWRSGGPGLDSIAAGLREVVDEDYLRYESVPPNTGRGRHGRRHPVRPAHRRACRVPGRRRPLPHVPRPRVSRPIVAVALYREGGIRGCEIGSVMFGLQPMGPRSRHGWSWSGWPSRVGSTPRARRLRDRGRALGGRASRRAAGFGSSTATSAAPFTARFEPL